MREEKRQRRPEITAPQIPGSAFSQNVQTILDGGADRNRTCDLLIANETLCQLSYEPIHLNLRCLHDISERAILRFTTFCRAHYAKHRRNFSLIASGISRILSVFGGGLHMVHHEERPAHFRRSRIEHHGDIGMIHHRRPYSRTTLTVGCLATCLSPLPEPIHKRRLPGSCGGKAGHRRPPDGSRSFLPAL
jgi:hypothetical protein